MLRGWCPLVSPRQLACVPPHCWTLLAAAGFSIKCPAQGLIPGQAYLVAATATLASTAATSPTSNALPLVMPAAGAPALVTAAGTSPTSGAANASPPTGMSFTRVGLLAPALAHRYLLACWLNRLQLPPQAASQCAHAD